MGEMVRRGYDAGVAVVGEVLRNALIDISKEWCDNLCDMEWLFNAFELNGCWRLEVEVVQRRIWCRLVQETDWRENRWIEVRFYSILCDLREQSLVFIEDQHRRDLSIRWIANDRLESMSSDLWKDALFRSEINAHNTFYHFKWEYVCAKNEWVFKGSWKKEREWGGGGRNSSTLIKLSGKVNCNEFS